MTDTYAVMGNPVAHSKSPFIHSEFAKQTAQDMRYLKIEVPLDKFQDSVYQFAADQGRGVNITVPFKEQAFLLAANCSARAKIAKAVNTLKFFDNEIYGDNTDGIGLIRDLTHHYGLSLKGKRLLILGAGGAVRGILHPLLLEQPSELVLANRTLNKAEGLATEFSEYGPLVGTSFEKLEHKFDLIINATSVSLSQDELHLPPGILKKTTFCYDLMYRQELTPFLKWAVSHGASQVADGIGMLVEQAAESFFIWRGVKPETTNIINQLKHS